MTEPTTEAGRALLDRYSKGDPTWFREAILLIEAQLRAEIAKGVEGLHRYSFAPGIHGSDGEFVNRAAVLALIRGDEPA